MAVSWIFHCLAADLVQGGDQHRAGAGLEPGQGAGGGEGEAQGDQGEGLGGLAQGPKD